MRIDLLGRRRRGSLAMEGLMILPVVMVAILLGRYVLEGAMTRQEVGVYTRGSTASAAAAETFGPADCMFDRTPFGEREGVDLTTEVACTNRNSEAGLRSAPGFWDALEDGARPFGRHGDLLRDVHPGGPPADVAGRGQGSMQFLRPDFLAMQSGAATQAAHLRPGPELYTHRAAPLRAGHDPAIWQALRREGVWRLFPEVFPRGGS